MAEQTSEPGTAAGRALLEAHRQTENTSGEFVYYPMDFRAAILAIEAEARAARLNQDGSASSVPATECPSCDDSWAAHMAGLHEERGL